MKGSTIKKSLLSAVGKVAEMEARMPDSWWYSDITCTTILYQPKRPVELTEEVDQTSGDIE